MLPEFPLPLTSTTTSSEGPPAPVGTTANDGLGNTYMLVQAKDAVTYAAGQPVTWRSRSGYTVTNDISNSLITTLMAGVAMSAPAENGYFWIQTGGYYASVKKDPNEDTWAAGDLGWPDASVDGALSKGAFGGTSTAATSAELLTFAKQIFGGGAIAVAASTDGSTDTVPCHICCKR